MTHDDRAKQAWQSAGLTAALPAIDEVRSAASAFDRQVRRRNWREGIAAVIVVAAFSIYAAVLPSATMRVASVTIVAGTIVVIWQLLRRAASTSVADGDQVLPLVSYRRSVLVRQRNALASVAAWYIAPIAPGAALFIAAPWIDGRSPITPVLVRLAVFIAVSFGIIWLNYRAARMLDNEIAELDSQAT